MKAVTALFVAAIAVSACATTPLAGSSVRDDGLARIDQSTRVGALAVTPLAVVEDSRCPINARCVWAGRLVLKTRVAGTGWHETVNLTLGQPYTTPGWVIALVSAEPGKMAGSPPSLPASLFSFKAQPTRVTDRIVFRDIADLIAD